MKRVLLFLSLSLLGILYVYPQTSEIEYKKYIKCIDHNNTARAQKLIAKGYGINSRDSEGKTPLLYSLQQDKTNFARLLLNAGANIRLADNQGNNCLHYAIENCRSDDSIVYELIDKGADFWAANNEGYTPLHFSILFSCYELPFYLIHKGADFYLVTGLNESSLHLSIESGCDTLSYFFIENDINIRQRDNRGNTALLAALDFQRHDVAIKLIEKGAHIDEFNNDSLDALFLAIANQDTSIVQLLLDKGAQIKRPQGQDPLIQYAANMENAAIVKLLLLHGAENPDSCQDNNDMCYLTAFIHQVNAEIVTDSLRTQYLEKSLQYYELAKKKYEDELRKLIINDTGLLFADLVAYSFASNYGAYYDPNFDYETERRNYLEDRILRCKGHIQILQNLLYLIEPYEKENNSELPPDETEEEIEIIEIP